jgi:hypothetical protein
MYNGNKTEVLCALGHFLGRTRASGTIMGTRTRMTTVATTGQNHFLRRQVCGSNFSIFILAFGEEGSKAIASPPGNLLGRRFLLIFLFADQRQAKAITQKNRRRAANEAVLSGIRKMVQKKGGVIMGSLEKKTASTIF